MHEKVLWILKRALNENNWFLKRKGWSYQQKSSNQQKSYENAITCYICKEKIENKYLKDKKYYKVRDQCHYRKI